MDKWNQWKKVLLKLLFPHPVLIFFLVNISAALLFYAFLGKNCPPAVAYASYALSAYVLTVVCVKMPAIIKKTKGKVYKNKYANKYLTEKDLRVRASLYNGLLINIFFAIFKVVMGVLYNSAWLFAMAGYNVVLSILRFILVYRDQTNRKEVTDYDKRLQGIKSYRTCGWLMLPLNIAVSVIVVMVVVDNQTIVYPGFMIYAIAAFTFYCLTMAIINMVKYWHRQNPVFSAVKRIGLAKALVSIFTLQVAMLTQFGGEAGMSTRLANGATGGAVCVLTLAIAILMIIDAGKDYKKMQEEMR